MRDSLSAYACCACGHERACEREHDCDVIMSVIMIVSMSMSMTVTVTVGMSGSVTGLTSTILPSNGNASCT